MNKKNNKGFSLIEIVVVLGIFILILAVGLVVNLSFFKSDIFSAERRTIVSSLEKARSRAMTNMYQTPHGFCYIEPNYVIFRGDTCAPASTNEIIGANAEIAEHASTILPTVVFSQLTGTTTGVTIHITNGIREADIIINNHGTINW